MAGINMQMLARGQLAWELTGDVFLVALVSSGFAPPILLFSLFGGTLADRWNRRLMIQYSQLIVSLVAGHCWRHDRHRRGEHLDTVRRGTYAGFLLVVHDASASGDHPAIGGRA